MNYIGIDPGTSGAFSVLDEQGNIIEMLVMPMIGKEYDVRAIIEFLSKYKNNSHVFIENVKAVSGVPVSSTSSFNFGFGVGLLNGIIQALEIPYTKVAVATWQKEMWEGVAEQKKYGKKDTKTMSLIASRRLFPKDDFLATSRSRVPHDGLVDASLIAEYGRRSLTRK